MINSVVLTGRLTKDVEMRTTATGNCMVQFSLAVDRKSKRQGHPEADFISCVAWGKTAELMDRYLSKGSLIGVEGSIQTGSYERNGQRIYTTTVAVSSVTFMGGNKARTDENVARGYKYPTEDMKAAYTPKNGYLTGVDDADDLPF